MNALFLIRILVLEAGKSDAQYPSIRVPAYETLLNDLGANWDRTTVPLRFSGQSLIDKVYTAFPNM